MTIRTQANQAPTIPTLGPDNAIDLDRLGTDDLQTFVKYDDIADGDKIVISWFGCGEHGEIVDKFNDEAEVVDDALTPEGMPVMIENSVLRQLLNGSVFYSYRVRKPGEATGDESLRLFFFVGRRPRAAAALPVVQIRDSHDLHVDLDTAEAIITPWVVPYQAMSVGDTVTLHCRRFYPDGSEYTPALAYPTVVGEGEPGKPLGLFLNRSDLLRVEDGSMELYYGIQYASATQETTFSTRQTFQLLAPSAAMLPALTIVGHSGGTINPLLFSDGLPLRIEGYPDMSIGDEVLCHATSSITGMEQVVLRANVDASTLDKGFFEFMLDPAWLSASQGASIDLRYEYAWAGKGLSSTPYPANVRAPLKLPMVIVKNARPDPDDPVSGEGVLDVLGLSASGVTIDIDPQANYGADDEVKVYWDGYGTSGKYTALAPVTPGSRTYNVPPEHIPANLDRAVPVYYTVLQDGDPGPVKSDVFVVRVLPIDKTHYTTIQSAQAQLTNGTIYISRIESGGELFTLPRWPYMREGQIVNAIINGKGNDDSPRAVPIFDNYPVAENDVTNGSITKTVTASDFQVFKLGSISVQVIITYEQGAETFYLPASFTLAS
ncbi:hypothetical protein HU715_015790 [Pseudomonas sp. SWRI12]|uniref:Uncharacterized protein n=1 Tax=Pseudomonas zanjanensis TaxID=2745496 RepID=A0A923JM46_9PSED|nr:MULTISPECIES: hypothetical protein [Pseudomonas]MBC3383555.1 hypothetical protein [Pseudomonas sp. SWRI179]MBV4496815.1 hypothetical protein [Pseudomonas zanjanensis]